MSSGIVWMIKFITKKGEPHLNICLGAPEPLVTPLLMWFLFKNIFTFFTPQIFKICIRTNRDFKAVWLNQAVKLYEQIGRPLEWQVFNVVCLSNDFPQRSITDNKTFIERQRHHQLLTLFFQSNLRLQLAERLMNKQNHLLTKNFRSL